MAQGSSNPTSNLTKVAGTAVSVNSGAKDAGTQRVILASDQTVVPISDNAGSLTVDAPVATPVFVRLSSGSAAVDTIPVSQTLGTAATRWYAQLSDGTNSMPMGDAAARGIYHRITDGTNSASVIATINSLKVDLSSVAGTATLNGGVAGGQGIGGIAASGTATASAGNPVLSGGIATTAAPTYTTATSNPLSLTTGGSLRVDVISALPAGTNAIGKLSANTGVTIGAVEIAATQTLAAVTTVSTVTNVSQLGGQVIAMGTGARSAGTLRVTIATDDVVLAAQSGTWNINNISGAISLPTGAATAAKQPALGTAGTASADVITVQGIASMTALKVDGSAVTQPVSGTVELGSTSLAALETITVQPGNTANTTPWLTRPSDGTNTAAIKAGSVAAASTDPALVVSFNGANSSILGTVTPGSAHSTSALQIAGSDGTNATRVRTDTSGNLKISPINIAANSANSTTTNLGVSAVFTGTSTDVSGHSQVMVNVYSSHASAANGLSLQFSQDGTNWDSTNTYTVAATTDFSIIVPVSHTYFRLVYTNGATLTTNLRIATSLRTATGQGTIKKVNAAINLTDTALSTRSVISGTTTGATPTALTDATVKLGAVAAVAADTALVVQLHPSGVLGTATVKSAITEPAFGTDTAMVVQTRDPVRIRPSETYRDPVDKMRVSTPQSMIDTDFEYGIQPTKWESLCLMNNRPTAFYDPTTGISNTAVTLTLPGQTSSASYQITNLTANLSTKVVTATVTSTLGIAVGTPIFLQGSIDTTVDGWWIVDTVTTNTSFTFLVNNAPSATAQFDSNKTYVYVGSYFSGSAISLDPSSTIAGTISVDATGTFTTTTATTFTIGQPIVISGTLGGTGTITGYATGNVYYVIATNGTTTFQLSATSGGAAITTTAGTPTGLTYTKSSVSVSGTTVIVKTADDHGLRVGSSIFMTGTSGLASGGPVNGSWVVATTPTNDTFTYTTNTSATATSPGVITVAGTIAGNITTTTGGYFTTDVNTYLKNGQAITITGTKGGTGTFTGYTTGNTYYIIYTNGYNFFQLSATPNGAAVTTVSGTITGLTFSLISAYLYPRQPGYIEHRPYDGGVQFSNETAYHGYQDIRQTRRYFRYQSGKGIQFSTGTVMKPPFYTESITSSGTTVTVNTKYPHGLLTGATCVVANASPAQYNGTFTITATTANSFTYTAASTPTSTVAVGFPITVSPGTWYGGSNRIGMFDNQNGFFYEFDGQTLYACVRKSTDQISGNVAVTQNSPVITGTNTFFGYQLKPGDYIVIRGMSYVVQQIQSNTSMTVYPEYRGQSGSNNTVTKTVETRVAQSSFNIDTVNSGTRSATNPNGFLLDLTKMQMFYMDYSWYGAGAVRFGFKDQRGEVIFVHRIVNSNVNTEAYMRSGNLPARYETNTLAPNSYLLGSLSASMTSIAQTLSSVVVTGSAGQISCTAADLVIGQRINITGTLAGSPTLSTVTIADTVGNFTCASTTLAVNQTVTIAGTNTGTGAVTNGTYYIIATNGSTTFQLSATLGGTAITTTAGTPVGLTYTLNAIAGYTTGTNYYITATNGSTTATLSTVAPSTGQTQTAVGTAPCTPTGLTYTLPNVIDVADTSLWPSTGTVLLTQTSAVGAYTEYITYTAKTATSVTIGSRAQTGGVTTAKAFTCRSTSPVNVELYTPQAAQTLSHWGSSVIMDGRYDDDKSLVFNTGLTSTIYTPTAGTRYPILSLRLAPSVDNGLTGLLGNREIINRMQLTLATMGAYTKNVPYRIEVLLNPRVTYGTFVPVGGSSLAQYCNHFGVGGAYGGESMFAFYTNSNDTISQSLEQVRDIGTSILGGGLTLNFPDSNLNKYPDGPDIVTIVAIPLNSTPSVSLTAITDTAGTFTCSATSGLAIGQTVTISGTPAGGPTLSTVAITGTAGQFSCASASLAIGQYITISGTFGGTGSITGYSNPTTYKVSAATATTFTLVTTAGAAIVTTTGTPTGLTYTINPIPGFTSGDQFYIIDTNGRTTLKLAATQLGTTALATGVTASLTGVTAVNSGSGQIAARINWTEAQA